MRHDQLFAETETDITALRSDVMAALVANPPCVLHDFNDELAMAKVARPYGPAPGSRTSAKRSRLNAQPGRREAGRMVEAERRTAWETLDGGEPSDDWTELEALITEADPAWWDLDTARWDLLYPAIPF
jgi:hypothetical protein